MKKIPFLFVCAAVLMMISSAAVVFSSESTAGEETVAEAIDFEAYSLETVDSATDGYIVAGTVIMKINEAGELVWQKDLFVSGLSFYSTVIKVDDGFIAAGSSIAKFNLDGNKTWEKTYNTSDRMFIYSITESSEGFVAVGSKESGSIRIGNTTQKTNDGAITKYSSTGGILWQNKFKEGHNTHFSSVVSVSDGFIAKGTSYDMVPYGEKGGWSSGNYKNFIVKYSDNGELEWQKSLDSGGSDIIGVSDGIIGFWSSGNNKVAVKYNSDGTLAWEKSIGSWSINSAIKIPDGIIAVGQSYGTHSKAGIIKISDAGDIMWKNGIGGNGSDEFLSVTIVPDGFVAVGCSFSGSFGTGDWAGIEEKGGYRDAIIAKFSNTGDVIWYKNFGGADTDSFKHVSAVPGGYVATGFSFSDSFGNGDWVGVKSKGEMNTIHVKYDESGNVDWAFNAGDPFDGLFGFINNLFLIIAVALVAVVIALIIVIYAVRHINKKQMKKETADRSAP